MTSHNNGLIDCRFHVTCPVCDETLEWHFRKLSEAMRYAKRVAPEHTHTPYLLIYDTMGPSDRRHHPDRIPTAQEAVACGK